MKSVLCRMTALFAVSAALLSAHRSVSAQLIIDDFSDTTVAGYPFSNNPSVVLGNSQNYLNTIAVGDVATVLGGKRWIGVGEGVATNATGTISFGSVAGIQGGVWQDDVQVTANAGGNTGSGSRGFAYGASTIFAGAGTNIVIPTASSYVTAWAGSTVILDGTSYAGVGLWLSDVNAGAIGQTFRFTAADSSGNIVENTQTITHAGAQVIKFLGPGFIQSGVAGFFGASASSSFDATHISSIGLNYDVTGDWHVKLDKLETLPSSSAPESSSIALVAGGSLPLGLVLLARRRKQRN